MRHVAVRCVRILSLLALTTPLSNAATWSVDDDGQADFTEVSDAILAAADGDVILVEPGDYGPFFLDKSVTIVGREGQPRPDVSGPIFIDSADGFTLARLRLQGVQITGITGPARIDDCRIRGMNGVQNALLVEGCAQVYLGRTTVRGQNSNGGNGGRAGLITTSVVTGSGTNFLGGDGAIGIDQTPTNGGAGLRIESGSQVVLVSGSVVGGAAGGLQDDLRGLCEFGNSGRGLVVAGSTVSLRGNPSDAYSSGDAGPEACLGNPGDSVRVQGGATVVWSGVDLGPVTTAGGGGSVIEANPFEPYATNNGGNAPGVSGVVSLFGPAGEGAFLIGSIGASIGSLPGVQDPLWIGFEQIFFAGFLATAGPTEPAQCPYTIPNDPALIGTAYRIQCVFQTLAGSTDPTSTAASNAVDIIVHQ